MTNQEHLQLIIETALKHGYAPNIDDFISWECIGFHVTDLSVRFELRGPGVMRSIRQLSITDLLYGDNLSLLKAVFKNDEFDDGDNIAERVACMTVVRPDKERLKVIYDLMVVSNEAWT